jgi:hypothetical protein
MRQLGWHGLATKSFGQCDRCGISCRPNLDFVRHSFGHDERSRRREQKVQPVNLG